MIIKMCGYIRISNAFICGCGNAVIKKSNGKNVGKHDRILTQSCSR